MSLKDYFHKLAPKKENDQELFLALEINSETVRASVWTVKLGKIHILRLSPSQEWEKTDELLQASDLAISSACEGISSDPVKIIFGLPHDWVETNSITSDKKSILAKICDKLKLKPVGFVVSQEALITYLKQIQGTPVSAILIRLDTSEIVLSLVHLGKIKGSENVGRSDDLALDIKEGLARFKDTQSLPARIILFDGLADFEEAKQQIISYDWMANLPFLHFPKVESLERDYVMKAIAIAGGSEVAKSLGFAVDEYKDIPQVHEVQAKPEENTEEKKVDAQDFGFVFGKDIKTVAPSEPEIKTPLLQENETINNVEPHEFSTLRQTNKKQQKTIGIFNKLLLFFKKIIKVPAKIMTNVFNKTKLLAVIGGLGFFVFGLIALWWLLAKADIVLYFYPKNLEKEIAFSEDTLPSSKNTFEVEGSKQADVTGEKTIGEKAKGSVLIYNKTELSKKLPKGTVLIRDDNLKFLLEEDVTIASSSSQTTSDGQSITWGKATAKIIADQVGESSNTSSGTNFSLKDYSTSSFAAKSADGLTGGTSQKVKVVTVKDRKNLLDALTKDLEDKATDQISSSSNSDKIVLAQSMKTKIVKQEFNKKVDEEAKSIQLDLKLSVEVETLKKQDIQELVKQNLADSVPSGFILSPDFQTDINYKPTPVLAVKAKLTPSLNLDNLAKELTGKSKEGVEKRLRLVENFNRAQIKIYPAIINIFDKLPLNQQNIKIEVKVE